MPEFSQMMPSLYDEMAKEALLPASLARLGTRVSTLARSPAMSRGLGGLGSGAGVGGLTGLVGGAGVSGMRGYREAQEAGATGQQAVAHGIARGLRGAAKGAIVGAGLGGAGMGAAAARGLRTPALTSAPSVIGSAARFGQRQVHGLTGWTPKSGISSIRGGSWAAAKRADEAEKALRMTQRGEAKAGLINRLRGGTPAEMQGRMLQGAEKAHTKAQKGLAASQKAEQMGLTSLPGYARSLRDKPLQTIRAGFGEQWHSADPLTKAFIYGYPAAAAAKELRTPSQEGGKGKAERVGRSMGELAWGMGPLPISSMMLAAPLLGAAGGGAGRILGKLRGKHQPVPEPPSVDPAGGEAVPSEHIFSERAMGMGGMT